MNFFYQDKRLVRLEDEAGRSVCFEYIRNRLTGVIDPSGNKKQYEYEAWGRIARIIDQNGAVTIQNTYDRQNRVIEQTMPDESKIFYRYVPERRYTEDIYCNRGVWNTSKKGAG